MALPAVFHAFVEKRPLSVMVQGCMERMLGTSVLDRLFEETAERQYTRSLLFSSLVQLMSDVVFKRFPAIHAAYQAEHLGVSASALYGKLNGVEPAVVAALVRHSATEATALVKELKTAGPPLLPGYRTKILDGNCLAATEHRLKELRRTAAGSLPGKSLVVLDPALGLVVEVFPCEDGHAQERSLLEAVLSSVAAKDLWVADRNFCTHGFLFDLARREAKFVIRRHGNLAAMELTPWRPAGRCATGTLMEQEACLRHEAAGEVLWVRLVRIVLEKPTRDGETTIELVTNLRTEEASAEQVAQLYQKRWSVEKAFQEVERHFRSEIDTLAYPKAALFGFCVALVAYNVLAVVKAALRAAHGVEKVEKDVSAYYMAGELMRTHEGMQIVIPSEAWNVFHEMSVRQLAHMLRSLAGRCDLRRYQKHPRGPKKPQPKRSYDPAHPHVATARLLAMRTKKAKKTP